MNFPRGFELFAILAVLVLLFGSRKLPDAARSLGRSMRIFKSETKGLRSDSSGELTAAAETPEEREQREFAEWKASRDGAAGSGSSGSGSGASGSGASGSAER